MEPARRDDWPLGPALKRARGKMAIREAARRAGISEGRWRQLETGYQRSGGYRIPISTTAKTVIAAATAAGMDVDDALVMAGFDPADYPPDAREDGGADLSELSDDELLAELCRRLAMRHQPQYPVPVPFTRSPYAAGEDAAVGGDEEGDQRRQLGSL